MKKRICIIGAGISGLMLARHLKGHADVVVYEKARGLGGRMSTRYAEPFCFDHGTQYFTARTEAFQSFLRPLIEAGLVAEWSGKVINLEIGKKESKGLWFEPHFVPVPNMNSLCKKLAEGLNIKLSTEVAPLDKKSESVWILNDKEGNFLGNYHAVISTAPPAQTLKLFQTALPADSSLHHAHMQGCFTLMIGFNKPWEKQWIAANARDNPIKWISINSSKPGRNKNVTAIVVHSRNDWAEKHMDDDIQEVQRFLIQQFELLTGLSTQNADYISLHRWKYAIVEETENPSFYVDFDQMIAATSDWASASRIEDVWLNAKALSKSIIEMAEQETK